MPSTEWNQMINELGRKYGSLEEHPFLDEKMRRLLVERIPAYVTGNIPGTMPAAFKKLYLEELPKMEYRAGYAESHPQEALDLAASVLGLGTPFGPSGPDTLGMVKGFHGSPRRFTKFKNEAMGTGTGGQVFGWGHYVSESEKVGKYYYDLGVKAAEERPIKLRQQLADAKESLSEELSKNIPRNVEILETYIKKLEKAIAENELAPSLYEVEVLPDVPTGQENWLVWDKQITKEQAKAIQQGLAERGVKFSSPQRLARQGYFGKEIYEALSKEFMEMPGLQYSTPDEVTSKFLDSVGIPGIKYPVGSLNPRRVPKKTFDFHGLSPYEKETLVEQINKNLDARFTPEDIEKRLAEDKILYTRNPSEAYQIHQTFVNDAAKDLGWFKEPHNYVVFNPENIKIKKLRESYMTPEQRLERVKFLLLEGAEKGKLTKQQAYDLDAAYNANLITLEELKRALGSNKP